MRNERMNDERTNGSWRMLWTPSHFFNPPPDSRMTFLLHSTRCGPHRIFLFQVVSQPRKWLNVIDDYWFCYLAGIILIHDCPCRVITTIIQTVIQITVRRNSHWGRNCWNRGKTSWLFSAFFLVEFLVSLHSTGWSFLSFLIGAYPLEFVRA